MIEIASRFGSCSGRSLRQVATDFDPLHVWLGIPKSEQPPSHYRLLGLAEFESDPAVISYAADRQMSHVRSFQVGPRAQECQFLLNELAAARLVLLAPNRKQAYDAILRQQANPTIEASPVAAAAPPAFVTKGKKKKRPAPHPVFAVLQIVVGGGVGLFAAVLILFYFWDIDLLGRKQKAGSVEPVAKGGSGVATPSEKPEGPSETSEPAIDTKLAGDVDKVAAGDTVSPPPPSVVLQAVGIL